MRLKNQFFFRQFAENYFFELMNYYFAPCKYTADSESQKVLIN